MCFKPTKGAGSVCRAPSRVEGDGGSDCKGGKCGVGKALRGAKGGAITVREGSIRYLAAAIVVPSLCAVEILPIQRAGCRVPAGPDSWPRVASLSHRLVCEALIGALVRFLTPGERTIDLRPASAEITCPIRGVLTDAVAIEEGAHWAGCSNSAQLNVV